MSEADEVAASLLPAAKAAGLNTWSSDMLRAWLRDRLPDFSEQLRDNVLDSLRDSLRVAS